jgi:single-strand DNA-binding protein
MNMTKKNSRPAEADVPAGINVVVVRGVLSSDPVERTLPSGDRLMQLEVTARDGKGAASSVPVAWFTTAAIAWEAGEEVVVYGSVRRRFFQAGGGPASRTEVVADRVVPIRQSAKVAAVLADAVSRLV